MAQSDDEIAALKARLEALEHPTQPTNAPLNQKQKNLAIGCVTVVVIVGLLLAMAMSAARNDTPASTPAPPAAVAPAQAEPSAPSTAEAEFKACLDADNTVGDDWANAIKNHATSGDFAAGEFHDHLKAMVDNCRPILGSFKVDQPDKRRARIALACEEGYRLRIQAYQDMLDGVAGTASANALIKGGELLAQCNAQTQKLAKDTGQ